MKNSIKIEIERLLHSSFLYISLSIGICCSLINCINNARIVARFTATIAESLANGLCISTSFEGFSLFVRWMAVNPASFGNNLFYFIWPILAALPFGWSYSADRRTGYYDQIVLRNSRQTYFISKYIAVFAGGGISIAFPVLLDLLVNAMICPTCVPDVTYSILPISNMSFMSQLIYTSPWIYALVWCVLDFLFGGAAACLCFVSGARFRFSVIVMLTPFLGFTLVDSFLTILCSISHTKKLFSPFQVAQAASLTINPGWVVLPTLCVMLVVSLVLGYMEMVKRELV